MTVFVACTLKGSAAIISSGVGSSSWEMTLMLLIELVTMAECLEGQIRGVTLAQSEPIEVPSRVVLGRVKWLPLG